MNKDLIKAVARFAPAVATAVGSPLAGAAIGALLNVFNVGSEEELLVAVQNATPEDLVRLQAVELEYKRILASENASARALQIASFTAENKIASVFIYVFAAAWMLFAAGYILGITFLEIPENNIRFADTVLGFLLGTVIGSIIQYFYGSSMGSKLKDEKERNDR